MVTFADCAQKLLREFVCRAVQWSLDLRLQRTGPGAWGLEGAPGLPESLRVDPAVGAPPSLALLHCALGTDQWPALQVVTFVIQRLETGALPYP